MSILVNFQNSFTTRLRTKCATNEHYISHHIFAPDVAALPCETIMFQKSHKFQNIVHVISNYILSKLVKHVSIRSTGVL